MLSVQDHRAVSIYTDVSEKQIVMKYAQNITTMIFLKNIFIVSLIKSTINHISACNKNILKLRQIIILINSALEIFRPNFA